MITVTTTPTITGTAITTTTEAAPDHATDRALHTLLSWCSPSYPVGGFSYSHGLEAAVEAGAVRDRDGTVRFVAAALLRGAGAVDGPLLAASWRAAVAGDDDGLDALAALGAAWRGTAETALEAMQQGEAFAAVTAAAWPEARDAAFAARHPRRLAHAVAFGAAAGHRALPLRPACFAFLSGFAANLISAAVRAVPLGQTDGQRATAALGASVSAATDAALCTPLDQIGGCAPVLDLHSMTHETQYTRLFRS